MSDLDSVKHSPSRKHGLTPPYLKRNNAVIAEVKARVRREDNVRRDREALAAEKKRGEYRPHRAPGAGYGGKVV